MSFRHRHQNYILRYKRRVSIRAVVCPYLQYRMSKLISTRGAKNVNRNMGDIAASSDREIIPLDYRDSHIAQSLYNITEIEPDT